MSFLSKSSPLLGTRALVGHHVFDPQGEDLGRIEELMIHPEHGFVEYAVLARGGVFGLGEQLLAVPWERLKFNEAANRIELEGDPSHLHEVHS